MKNNSHFDSVEKAVAELRAGKMVIVVDDENRENEGDLIIPGVFMTPEKMAFIIRHTGGVVCLALSQEIADQLDLSPMVERNTAKRATAYTVSIDAASVHTGISAEDRAATVLQASQLNAKPGDLSRPGHIFPLRAQAGGVLYRAGHTEAGTDLCRLAGVRESAVLSELMHDDGTMMRLPALREFASEHGLSLISIADLIEYRRRTEKFIRLESESDLETTTGLWRIKIYSDTLHPADHIALVKGKIDSSPSVLVRVHSECATGDILGSRQCDCGEQLHQAMKMIDENGSGVVLYLRGHEGRGIGLVNKIFAYDLQKTKNLDTVEANLALGFSDDLREYGVGAQILCDLGVQKMKLLTNNPKKMAAISGYGLEVTDQVPLEIVSNPSNEKYLKTKREKMGHTLRNL